MNSICAVVAFRNEEKYLPTLLDYMKEQGVDVFLIDNSSDDKSSNIVKKYMGSPVIGLKEIPFTGLFDLSSQIKSKEEIISNLRHPWIIHQDADELLESNVAGETLSEMAARAEKCNISFFDFDEFVFLPDSADGYQSNDYRRFGLNYYFFQPHKFRLNRMFKKSIFGGFGNSGGHNIAFRADLNFENSHNLRHYIVLSSDHAKLKYSTRRFSGEDLSKGWHSNRLNISEKSLNLLGGTTNLSRLESFSSRSFDRSNPQTSHFWDW